MALLDDRAERGALGHLESKLHSGIDQPERQSRRLRTRENAFLPGADMGTSRGVRGDYGSRRKVSAGPEILIQGTSHDRFNEHFWEIGNVAHAVADTEARRTPRPLGRGKPGLQPSLQFLRHRRNRDPGRPGSPSVEPTGERLRPLHREW